MKFREIILESGTKIILGKDAESNDELMKKFKGKPNIIIHTRAPGSSFCVINSLNPSKEDIYTSGAIVAKYSQDWRDNKRDILVHVFRGIDISKNKNMKIGMWNVKKFKCLRIKKEEIENQIKLQ